MIAAVSQWLLYLIQQVIGLVFVMGLWVPETVFAALTCRIVIRASST